MSVEQLGQRIKELRKARGLTQEVLAEKAEISAKYLSDLERGSRNPTFSTTEKIAAGLGVALAELVSYQTKVEAADDDRGDEEAIFEAVKRVIKRKDPDRTRRLRVFIEQVFR